MKLRYPILLLAILYAIFLYCAVPKADATPIATNARVTNQVASIGGQVPVLPVDVPIVVAPCPGLDPLFFLACNVTDLTTGITLIYIAPSDVGDKLTLAHEIGHSFDRELLSVGVRNKISRLFGHFGDPWVRYGGADSNLCLTVKPCLNEWFADGFSACALDIEPAHDSYQRVWGTVGGYGLRWTPRLKKELCRIIVKVGSEAETS